MSSCSCADLATMVVSPCRTSERGCHLSLVRKSMTHASEVPILIRVRRLKIINNKYVRPFACSKDREPREFSPFALSGSQFFARPRKIFRKPVPEIRVRFARRFFLARVKSRTSFVMKSRMSIVSGARAETRISLLRSRSRNWGHHHRVRSRGVACVARAVGRLHFASRTTNGFAHAHRLLREHDAPRRGTAPESPGPIHGPGLFLSLIHI